MSQYILVLLWLAVLGLIGQYMNVYTKARDPGPSLRRVSRGFAVFSVLPLIWWAATRPDWFIDTDTYIQLYRDLPVTAGEIGPFLAQVNKDKGFSLLSILIKSLFGDDPTIYFLLLALVQALAVAFVFRRYSCSYVLSLFLFVASTDYLSWMHNGMRQFTAVCMIFAATELMLKKKYLPLTAVILLASTIHASALLMLPIVLVVQGRAWNPKTLLAIIAFVVAIVFVDGFTSILDTMLADTQYTNVVSDWQTGGDDGTNPIRVLVYSIPTLLSLTGLRYIRAAKDPVIDLACNMGIISTMLYCLSVVTSGIFIGRLPIYCSMYAMGILLPWELKMMFTKESSRLMKLMMSGGYLLFYYYQTHFVWGLI